MQWRKFTDASQNKARSMLCCGRRKESGRGVPDVTSSPGRAPPPVANHTSAGSMLLQSDFRKVSGISSEIFRQIEMVENDHDSTTAAALEAVERRGEMIVRILELRQIGRNNIEAGKKFFTLQDPKHIVQLVEIVKRPGQTLGLYIREGDGGARADGVFISRIALESAVYSSGCLKVGDEILAVNLVDVRRMSLDDVVIIMSIPRRLLLVTRQRKGKSGPGSPSLPPRTDHKPPVVVLKRDLRDEDDRHQVYSHENSSGTLRQRHTGDGREERQLGAPRASPEPWRLPPHRGALTTQPTRSGSEHQLPRHDDTHSLLRSSLKANATGSLSRYNQRYGSGLTSAGLMNSGLGNAGLASSGLSGYGGLVDSPGLGTGSPSLSALGSYANGPSPYSSGYGGGVGVYGNSPSGYSTLPYATGNMGSSSALAGFPSYGSTAPGSLGTYGTLGSAFSTSKFPTATAARRNRSIDYSSDTEASCPTRTPYYYGYRGNTATLSRDLTTKFNSLPRDVRASTRMTLGRRLGSMLPDENEENDRLGRGRLSMSPSVFTSDEYRAWLSRAPSTSALYDVLRPRNNTHYSAENIHDALKHLETSSRFGSSLNISSGRTLPPRSLSTQHIARSGSLAGLGGFSSGLVSGFGTAGSGIGVGSLGLSGLGSLGRRRLELDATCPSPVPTPSARTGRHIDINPSEFLKYKADKPLPGASASMSGISRFAAGGGGLTGVSGLLWVHLLSGRGLLAPDHAPPRDLYTVLECDRVHKARTVVRTGDAQFDWDESFELDLVENKQLDLLVYSWDPQQRHRLCVRGAVRLGEVCVRGGARLALRLEPRGTLYLRLRHTPPADLYRRRLAPPTNTRPHPPLFGADLDAVVSREARETRSGAGVPAILKRCVEEIERRGLDIIGLYRLCGSATKKRILREAFERNPRGVELSPDSVPDINVITGLLKDYLRELPQPLITPALTQLIVDALGSMGVERSSGAALISRCIEALPKAARATLLYLLDHFALVVAAADRNKMGPSALAAALAGPLMLNAPRHLDHRQPIALLKCMLQIWPPPKRSVRRGEPAPAQRGGRANALPADTRLPPTGRVPPSANLYRPVAAVSAVSPPQAQSAHRSPVRSPDPHVLSSAKGGQYHPRGVSAGGGGRLSSPASPTSCSSDSQSPAETIKRGGSASSILRQPEEPTHLADVTTTTAQPTQTKEVTWRIPEVAPRESLPRINESNREEAYTQQIDLMTIKKNNIDFKCADDPDEDYEINSQSSPMQKGGLSQEALDDEIDREIYKRDLEVTSYQKSAYDTNGTSTDLEQSRDIFKRSSDSNDQTKRNYDCERNDMGRHTLSRIQESSRETASKSYDLHSMERTRDDNATRRSETLPRKFETSYDKNRTYEYSRNDRDTLSLLKESSRESPSRTFETIREPKESHRYEDPLIRATSPRAAIPGTSAGLAVTLNDEPLAGFQMAPVSSQAIPQAMPSYALPAYSSTNPFLQNYDPEEEVEAPEVDWRVEELFARPDA